MSAPAADSTSSVTANVAATVRRVIVIGGSSGSFPVMEQIARTLEPDIPAAVLMIFHVGSGSVDGLVAKLEAGSRCEVSIATDSEALQEGRIYLAPPRVHTTIDAQGFRLRNGPRVNRARPSIDVGMRSAAVTYGPRTIGVLLSGMLNDGAAGLEAIAQCGGLTVVQHPDDAAFQQMPASAITSFNVGHVADAAAIGELIDSLVRSPSPPPVSPPVGVVLENRLDASAQDDLTEMGRLGTAVPLGCPDCGGPLWEIDGSAPPRYRCHVGHTLSSAHLLLAQDEDVERALWLALRTLAEKARTQDRLAGFETSRSPTATSRFGALAIETRAHAAHLLRTLVAIASSAAAGPAPTAAASGNDAYATDNAAT